MNKFNTLIAISLLGFNHILCDSIKKPTKKISLPYSFQIIGRTIFNNTPEEIDYYTLKYKNANELDENNPDDKKRIEKFKTILKYPGILHTTPSTLFTKSTEKFGEILGTKLLACFGWTTSTK